MAIDPISFVRRHGVVLESAKGHVPNLADAVAGVAVRGSWWKHPEAKNIFRATRLVRNSDDVIVCRLIEGKITYVDRRLWPALVSLSVYFSRETLSAIREEHSPSGAHIVKTLPFPKWVPSSVVKAARALSEEKAAAQLGQWATAILQPRGPRVRSARGVPSRPHRWY